MKRIIVTAATIATAAAFAMPSTAPAQDVDIYINPNVTCPNGVTECVRTWVNWTIDRVNDVGPIIGNACEVVFPNCTLLGE